MRAPALNASNGDLIPFGHFAWVSVEVDDETAGLGLPLKASDQNLRKAVGARNQSADGLVEARARRGVPRRRLNKWLRQLERDAKAAFGGDTRCVAYVRILPRTAAQTLKLPHAERWKAVGNTVAALLHADTPKVLAASQKAGDALVKQLATCDATVTSAQAAVTAAMLDIKTARTAWFEAVRGLQGALQQKFTTDRDRIDSYFPESTAKPKAKDVPEDKVA